LNSINSRFWAGINSQAANNRSVALEALAGPNGQPQLEINQQNVSWPDLNAWLVNNL